MLLTFVTLIGVSAPANAEYIQSGGYRWAGLAQRSDCLRYRIFYSDDDKFLREETTVVDRSYCMGGSDGGTTQQTSYLKFDANGGENAPGIQKAIYIIPSGWSVLVPEQEPTFEGYQFLGWADSGDSLEAQYNAGQRVPVPAGTTKTVYAIWKDVTPPVIKAPSTTLIQQGEMFDPMKGVSATDNRDGDITSKITVSGDKVDVNTPGTYTVTYNVSDSAGNKAEPSSQTVTVTASGTTIACAPQTGDPAASVWQAASLTMGLVSAGLGVAVLRMRRRVRRMV